MIERLVSGEFSGAIWSILSGISVAVALTQAQRRSIIERDGGEPQMRHYDELRGWWTGGYCELICQFLQVHHISTQRSGGGNEPENLITLAQCEHTGVCPARQIVDGVGHGKYTNEEQFVVHPDIREATMNYNGDPGYFQQYFAARNEAVARGETYHNSDHDEEMREAAAANTANASARGWKWKW